jgi:predicted regulator of Ras-like GTPase activity (Roadblock/LC7/MglB family)
MEKHAKRLILLFSLILVVIPMVIFPKRVGLPLVSLSAVFLLCELVYYAAAYYFLQRRTTLSAVLAGAAVTLVYRLALGAAFGVTIIVMYGLDSSIAFSLGMAKYLPALLLHALAAPFVMRPVYLALAESLTPQEKPRRRAADQPIGLHVSAPVTARPEERPRPTHTAPRVEATPHAHTGLDEGNQFDRTLAYLAESGAVKLALVVDDEGLPLARFSRCEEDVDVWAPLAIVIESMNQQLLNRYHRTGEPEKIEVTTQGARVILRRIGHVTLMVLADHGADETIHIRMAQAADKIRKYMSERYSPTLFARVEERYVSHS